MNFHFFLEKDNSNSANKVGGEIGSRFAEKSKGLFSADDWQCSKSVSFS